MSNVIKSSRVRTNETQIELGKKNETFKGKEASKQDEGQSMSPEMLAKIEDKHQKKLEEFEIEIQKRREAVDNKIEEQLHEAMSKCNLLEEEAKGKYNTLIEQAEAQKEAILKHAHEEAEQIAKNALKERQTLIENVEGEIAETIITLVDHIISEELIGNVKWLRALIRKMLKVNHITGSVKLVVSEQVMQQISENETEFRKGLPSNLIIEKDDTLSNTACQLVTNEGAIEYDVQDGLEQVIKELQILSKLS